MAAAAVADALTHDSLKDVEDGLKNLKGKRSAEGAACLPLLLGLRGSYVLVSWILQRSELTSKRISLSRIESPQVFAVSLCYMRCVGILLNLVKREGISSVGPLSLLFN